MIPVLLIFVFVSLLIFIFSGKLEKVGFNVPLLYFSNMLLFLLTAGAFALQFSGARSANHNAFMRSIMGAIMLKMFIVIIALLSYIFLGGRQVNKPSLFTAMGLYLVYTIVEVKQLLKLVRKKS